jgi:adenylate cyclase
MKQCLRIYIFVLFLTPASSYGQDVVLDSLNLILNNAKGDSDQVNTENFLSSKYLSTQPDYALEHAKKAKDLAEKIGFLYGEAYALKNIGRVYYLKGKYPDAVVVWRESLKLFEILHDENGQANLLNNIGAVFYDQGDDENALVNYLKSLQYSEKIGNKLRMATAMQNIGTVYLNKINTHDKALDYFSRALQIGEEMNFKDVVAEVTVNMGEIFLGQNQNDSALFYFRISLETLKSSGDSASMPYTYNDIGKVYRKRKDYSTAVSYHLQALKISNNTKVKLDIAQSYLGLADTYFTQGQVRTALDYYKQAEQIANEISSKQELKNAYQGLSYSYSVLKDYQNAFKYQRLLTNIKDTIYNRETDKKLASLEYNFKIQKKEGEINLLTKDKALQELDLKRQKTARNSLAVGFILIMIIAFIIYRNDRIKAKTNKILDNQKAEIEGLLLNILPAEVAAELQKTGKATPQFYPNVSVLFSDFKSFTKIADDMPPQELVSELNAHFMAFDDIVEKYNLEKIKTIGDAYMCAGGIPTQDSLHPVNMVCAGLEMQDYIKQNNAQRLERGLQPWELRIGIHTGSLVAGVVGRKKYAYDIWGTTVNIASRMESNGETGLVNISAATHDLVKDKFACMYRGKIYAKNIGEIDMYLVENKISTILLANRIQPESSLLENAKFQSPKNEKGL